MVVAVYYDYDYSYRLMMIHTANLQSYAEEEPMAKFETFVELDDDDDDGENYQVSSNELMDEIVDYYYWYCDKH